MGMINLRRQQIKEILGRKKERKKCVECKYCIGEPTFIKIENRLSRAYSCFGGNPMKKGMFDCEEEACEFFKVED